SVALASVASGYLAITAPAVAPTMPVVPISRFFPDDGHPGILDRNPKPPYTLAQRFRNDVAATAAVAERELTALMEQEPGAPSNAQSDGVRRALLALSTMAESYGATSISALAITIARAPLTDASERNALKALASLLQDKTRSDSDLAARVKDATLGWPGRRTPSAAQAPAASRPVTPAASRPVTHAASRPVTPAASRPFTPPLDTMTHVTRGNTPTAPRLVIRDLPPVASPSPQLSPPALIPIETLLYSGNAALERARQVRDELRAAWVERVGIAVDPVASALLDELSDLLDLAVPA
ncbi:MAG: hypothetical protein M3Y64_06870, partial [Gemmatimonadota bacterium]|nr:hypothetical protein [Gemmatimonadota bacterium]